MTNPMPHAQTQSEAERKRHNREHPAAHKTELAGQVTAGSIGSAFGAAKLRDSYKDQYPKAFTGGVKHAVHVGRAHGVTPQRAAKVVRVVAHGKPGFKSLVGVATAGTVATGAHRSVQISDAIERRKDKISMSHEPVEGDGILEKSEPHRAASAPIRLRVTPPPKHAARPYVGRRRVLTRVDKIKALGIAHSPRLFDAAEAATDLFKAACCTGEMQNVPRTAYVQGIGKVRVVGYHGDGKFHVVDGHDDNRVYHRSKLNFHRTKGSDMAKCAFGVEHVDYLSKALTGTEGDKRNTKTLAAGYGGAVAGGLAGRQIGARSAGTTVGAVRRGAVGAAMANPTGMVGGGAKHAKPVGPIREGARMGRNAVRGGVKAVNSVPGGTAVMRGSKIGTAAGLAVGAGAYAEHRHHKNKISMSADSGCAFVDERLSKSAASDLARGAKKGAKLGGARTYSVKGGTKATRVGIRAGVAARNAAVPTAAAGSAFGAGAAHGRKKAS